LELIFPVFVLEGQVFEEDAVVVDAQDHYQLFQTVKQRPVSVSGIAG